MIEGKVQEVKEAKEVSVIESKIELIEQKIVTIRENYDALIKKLKDLEVEKNNVTQEINMINGSFVAFTEAVNLLKAQE